MSDSVIIESRDYWFKVVEMLQQNWALIEPAASGVMVYFINDASGVFDEMQFPTVVAAAAALRLNGFNRFVDNPRASAFLRVPPPPFRRQPHPNGLIYSSGRFWRSP
jgi:hypothetical protein